MDGNTIRELASQFTVQHRQVLQPFTSWSNQIDVDVTRPIMEGNLIARKRLRLKQYYAETRIRGGSDENLFRELAFLAHPYYREIESDEWFREQGESIAILELIYAESDDQDKLHWGVLLAVVISTYIEALRTKERNYLAFDGRGALGSRCGSHCIDPQTGHKSVDFIANSLAVLNRPPRSDALIMSIPVISSICYCHALSVSAFNHLQISQDTSDSNPTEEVVGMLAAWGKRFNFLYEQFGHSASKASKNKPLGLRDCEIDRALCKSILVWTEEYCHCAERLASSLKMEDADTFAQASFEFVPVCRSLSEFSLLFELGP